MKEKISESKPDKVLREGRRMRLKGLVKKEFLQILRDPSSIAIAFLMPVLLLFLFDALLIVAVLLSLQEGELVEQEIQLLETRTVYELVITRQIMTRTEVITEIVPYGSIQ